MPETTDTAELEIKIAALIKQATFLLERQFDEVRTRRAEGEHDEALDLTVA